LELKFRELIVDKRRVLITGLGVVSPFGNGRDVFWDGLTNGRSGARRLTEFDTTNLPTQFAAPVPLSDGELGKKVRNQKSLKTLSRSGMMAIIAAQEALDDSQIDLSRVDPYRMGTSIGAGGTGLWDTVHSEKLINVFLQSIDVDDEIHFDHSRVWPNVLHNIHPLTPLRGLSNVPTSQIAIMTNARGHCQTITTACTSSAQAIGEAFRLIRYGYADLIIAGGADSMINPYGLVAFSMLGVLSTNNREWQTACRPFDRRRDGFMIGEGAAMVIMESSDFCRSRNGNPYAEILGYGCTNDAFRLTDEPPKAWGSIAAIRGALHDANVAPEEVDYINAHGTGTKMNDRTETYAIKTALGESAYTTSVSSIKSMVGHLVAAAGAIEFAACLLAIRDRRIPPTINYQEKDPTCDLDYCPNTMRESNLKIVLSNSFGFGGQNACLVLGRPDIGMGGP
jgi:3-oxoacyl-[acyl-carrier-protein] synthase II